MDGLSGEKDHDVRCVGEVLTGLQHNYCGVIRPGVYDRFRREADWPDAAGFDWLLKK